MKYFTINELTKTSTGISNIPNAKYIADYTSFLNKRKAIKEQIQLDWNNK